MAAETNVRAVAPRQETANALSMWDAEQLDIIKRLICPDASDAELALFGQVCQRTGLDPFARQIYGIKRKGRLSIQTGIDGFRLQAERSRDYAGQEGPQWCGEDGVWRDVWLSKEHPSAARVGVYRKGWSRPVWGIATWTEYAQYGQNGPTEMWARMPANQLAKCAEAQALRKAFPAELSGLYAKEEMDQADSVTTIDVAATPANPEPERELCDVKRWNRAWHDTVKGTRFEEDEAQHKYVAWHTENRFHSLTAFLEQATTEEAGALVASIARRITAERKKKHAELVKAVEGACALAESRGIAFDLPSDLEEQPDAELQGVLDMVTAALNRPAEDEVVTA